jgi:hypothetical protein
MLKEKTVESIEETIDDTQANNPTPEEESPLRSTKYDFVPGETVIFEAQLENEHNGEFPSKWDLSTGNVEIARFGEMEGWNNKLRDAGSYSIIVEKSSLEGTLIFDKREGRDKWIGRAKAY